MTASGIERRLTRLEVMRDDMHVARGVSGILAVSRDRADRLARGLPTDGGAPPPPWAFTIRAAMVRHRQERQA